MSSCLLGQEVRYDGGHKRDRFIVDTLGQYFEFVPICPEMALGLGVPRQPIRLQGSKKSIRVVGVDDPSIEVTQKLSDYAMKILDTHKDLSAYIFKSKSPSCGIERVKIYNPKTGIPNPDGTGQYAKMFIDHWPELPVEEEGRLNDPILRENFLERVFTYKRWQELVDRGVSSASIVEFHTQHKLMILAHNQQAYRKLGQMIADCGSSDINEFAGFYIRQLMSTMKIPAKRKNHTNVLQHIQGYLKKHIDAHDKQELGEVIERYRLGQLPLIVPITLLNHHFRKHPNEYISQQIYLNPHPPELMLRNFI